jgi:2-polyprenyl-3-methyl-5-hydroxy-6-metoxy-1,4-benzoquinol methylase
MREKSEKVDFDRFAESYESLLENQLGFFEGSRDYFSEYKADIIRERTPEPAPRILDFGTGIGLTLPFVRNRFPSSEIHASDISEASLARVRQHFPDITVIPDAELGAEQYDLILVITVIHHVAPDLRPALFKRLESMLRPGGRIWIFEHNPYNPVTQRMVATCPFDKDAVLISAGTLSKLILETTSLSVSRRSYTLFFPQALASLRPVEPFLGWLPLGGQYYVVAQRS